MRPARPSSEQPTSLSPEGAVTAALEASERTSTSLSGLLAALTQFTSGVEGAQQTSDQLKRELNRLRDLLADGNRESARLREQVTELQASLDEARHFNELEHKYVRDEQDRFIAALIDEYEAEIATLRATSGRTGNTSDAALIELSNALAKAESRVDDLLTERDRTRSMAQRAQQQRDVAQREVARLRVELERAQSRVEEVIGGIDDRHTRPTEPPPGGPKGPPTLQELSGVPVPAPQKPVSREPDVGEFESQWDTDPIPAPPPSLDVVSGLTANPVRNSAPPLELQAALTKPESNEHGEYIPDVEQLPIRSPASQNLGHHAKPKPRRKAKAGPTLTMSRTRPTEPPPSAESAPRRTLPPTSYRLNDKPPLKRKLDHSMRPLVGYSKGAAEVQPEQLHAGARTRK